jgi:hypothetical protein
MRVAHPAQHPVKKKDHKERQEINGMVIEAVASVMKKQRKTTKLTTKCKTASGDVVINGRGELDHLRKRHNEQKCCQC